VSKRSEQIDGPGIERTITLTDAVVAIAMTLLILPLVDAVSELDLENLAALWTEDSELVTSFVISFVVIYAFWTGHGGLYRRLDEAGLHGGVRGLGLINLFWLLVIAFLPFPTALIGRDLNTVTAPVYIGTMLVLSLLTFAMTVVIRRAVGARMGLAWLTPAVFGLCTVASMVNAQVGVYMLLLLIVAAWVEGRSEDSRRT
jgi:uncharacterized membrane protein